MRRIIAGLSLADRVCGLSQNGLDEVPLESQPPGQEPGGPLALRPGQGRPFPPPSFLEALSELHFLKFLLWCQQPA